MCSPVSSLCAAATLLLVLPVRVPAVAAVPRVPASAATLDWSAPTSSESDDVDGDSVCCRREQHFASVGVDMFGEDLVVDVGRCRRHCPHASAVSREEFERMWQRSPDADPVQLFLRRRGHRSCRRPGRCHPVDTVAERHFTRSGAITVWVTRRCGCVRRPAACGRVRRDVTFHPGTPHQRRVDVGACDGPCAAKHDSCRPLQNKTVSIDGPNGAELVSVIEECTCAHGCYRMTLTEQVYDYTDSDHHPSIKSVDVGQCVGACTADQRGRDCVYSSPEEPGKCLMSLQYHSRGCVASGSEQHFYRDQEGHEKALHSITGCTCR